MGSLQRIRTTVPAPAQTAQVVAAALGWLQPGLRGVLLQLSVVPAKFGVQLAAAVTERGDAEARCALEVGAHWVTGFFRWGQRVLTGFRVFRVSGKN